jgi:hypothetical protein
MSSTRKIRANKDFRGFYSCAKVVAVLSLFTGITVAVGPLRSASAHDDDVSFDTPIDFDTPISILGTADADAEPPQITASGKHLYVIWHEFPPEIVDQLPRQPDIYFSRSTDGGQNFQRRENLSNSVTVESSGEQIATSGQNVFVVWTETDAMGQSKILFRRSRDGGATFREAKELSNLGNPINPRVASSGKNVFVAWQADGPAGVPDIFFMQSSDSGRNFDDADNISDNDGSSEFAPVPNVLPQIALSGNFVFVTWRDNTNIAGDTFEISVARGE